MEAEIPSMDQSNFQKQLLLAVYLRPSSYRCTKRLYIVFIEFTQSENSATVTPNYNFRFFFATSKLKL